LNYRVYLDTGGLERLFALNILEGHQLPYRDFNSEYPPLAILGFILPGLLFKGPFSYSVAFAAEIFIFDAVIIILLSRLTSRLNLPIWEVLGIYTIFLLAIGPITPVRHDMIPSMLVMATLYAFITGHNRLAWILLGLGVMTKVYPIFLAPLFILFFLRHKRYSDLLNGVNGLVAVVAVVAIPWLIIDANGFLYFLTYQAQRGLQSESSYATILLVGQLLGLTRVEGLQNFGSWNISSPLADNISSFSTYIMAGLLLTIYIIYFKLLYSQKPSQSVPLMQSNYFLDLTLRFSLITIMALLITDKVFSPQYLIWVFPLMTLLTSRRRYLIWFLFIVIGILTQYVFPYNYLDYEMAKAGPILVEATRNVLILLLIVLVGLSGRREFSSLENKTYYISENN
jgi:uncharacterized membrane protein